MSNLTVIITGDKVTCNGKKAKYTPHGTNGRNVYMTKDYVIKVDDNGYHHDDMGVWMQIEPEDQQYFVPCIAQGETEDGTRWSVQPFVNFNTRESAKNDNARAIVYELIDKYNLSDMHSDNWGVIDGKPIIFDYGMS
jgi:hypothetical protein